MTDEVKVCVDAKTGFFETYFTVPEALREDVDRLTGDIAALGESCGSAKEFEVRFVSDGLSDRFNALLPKCTPKARKMTREEKRRSAELAGEILYEHRGELARDALADAAGTLVNRAEDRMLQENHERMISEGTHAEHTIRRNRAEAAGNLLGFFRDKLRKGD